MKMMMEADAAACSFCKAAIEQINETAEQTSRWRKARSSRYCAAPD